MSSTTASGRVSKPAFWAGWVVGALPLLMMLGGAVFGFVQPEKASEGMHKLGYPDRLFHPILIVEVVCAVLYLIPQTAVLGAILLTGYLGGATASHLRAGDPTVNVLFPVIFGALIWLGLFLRDRRVRALIPLRR